MKTLAIRKFKVPPPKGESSIYSGRCAGGSFGPAPYGQLLLVAADDETLADAWQKTFDQPIDTSLVYDASVLGTKYVDGLVDVPRVVGMHDPRDTLRLGWLAETMRLAGDDFGTCDWNGTLLKMVLDRFKEWRREPGADALDAMRKAIDTQVVHEEYSPNCKHKWMHFQSSRTTDGLAMCALCKQINYTDSNGLLHEIFYKECASRGPEEIVATLRALSRHDAQCGTSRPPGPCACDCGVEAAIIRIEDALPDAPKTKPDTPSNVQGRKIDYPFVTRDKDGTPLVTMDEQPVVAFPDQRVLGYLVRLVYKTGVRAVQYQSTPYAPSDEERAKLDAWHCTPLAALDSAPKILIPTDEQIVAFATYIVGLLGFGLQDHAPDAIAEYRKRFAAVEQPKQPKVAEHDTELEQRWPNVETPAPENKHG